jgi:hypothetical protein
MTIDKEVRNSNISELFILPVLGIPKHLLLQNSFINCYLFNEEEDIKYENCLYLLFKPKNMEWFNNFVASEEDRGANILEEYDYGGIYTMLVYNIPEKFRKDVDVVLQGKYSKVSKEYKDMFPKLISDGVKESLGLAWCVLHKKEYIKKYWEEELDMIFPVENEYWKLYEISSESFNVNKLDIYGTKD